MLRLENTLTGKKEEFKPIRGKTVRFYTCGPTVYNFVHIGNLRTYIFEDILRRALRYSGYRTLQVMNITDVEDKIIKKALAERKTIKEITVPFTKAFMDDLKKLHIERPEVMPRATSHIKEMISLIETLIRKGFAYKGNDGSIYFDISKFEDYGKLTKVEKKSLKAGARIEADEYGKDEVQDFVLWKAKKDDEPSWKSPFGPGRPGWHIECSAMGMKYLGSSFDIHTGAVDNAFPHHENEIAQSEAATGKEFSRFWLHGEHLLVGGEKMAKSAGNFYTMRDIEEKGYDPLVFRYLVLGNHYRSKLNFTWESLDAARNGLQNLRDEIKRARAMAGKSDKRNKAKEKEYRSAFKDSLENDLGTPECLATLWSVLKDKELSPTSKISLIEEMDDVLGLGIPKIKNRSLTPEVKMIIKEREIARKEKDFARSDVLRNKARELGYRIEDTPKGPIATSE